MQHTVGNYTYATSDCLGHGSFATVYKARHKLTGQTYAVKAIDLNRLKSFHDKDQGHHLESEVRIMKELDHPNIVALYEIIPAENTLYMIIEYCAGGDLALFIRKNDHLSETRAFNLFYQLIQGLAFLHGKNIIHRDVKNLLLVDDSENPILKIADFGFARVIQPTSMATTYCGSPLYMAPEVILRKQYTGKADLWSVGTVLYEMLTGRPPYRAQSPVELISTILKSSSKPISFPSGINVSPDCRDLVSGLLTVRPSKRMSLDDVLVHRWYRRNTATSGPFPSVREEVVGGAGSDGGEARRKALPLTRIEGLPRSLQSGARPKKVGDGGKEDGAEGGTAAEGEQHTPSGTHLRFTPVPPSLMPVFKRDMDSPIPPTQYQQVPAVFKSDDADLFERSCVFLEDQDDEQEDNAALRPGVKTERFAGQLLGSGLRAIAATNLADIKVDMNYYGEGLAIYVKSLLVLKSILQDAKQQVQKRNIPVTPRLRSVVDRLRDFVVSCQRKIESLVGKVPLNDRVEFPEMLIFEFVKSQGEEGALHERLGNYNLSRVCYQHGKYLLEFLLYHCNCEDNSTLNEFIRQFDRRLEIVNMAGKEM